MQAEPARGSVAATPSQGPLGIVCGSGALPFAVADAVRARGRDVRLYALAGWADPARVQEYAHAWVRLGGFGKFRTLARHEGVRDVVFIGGVLRPGGWQLVPDFATLRLLPRVFRLLRGGDDHLLSGVARIFEEHGFRVLGAHEVAPDLLAPEGALGSRQPDAADLADAARGLAAIDALGPFDVGQAVVVAGGRIIAVEAAEGTDAMLERVAALRASGRIDRKQAGVLVKAPKPQQDRRIDLPSIGPQTVTAAANAGLAGIAVRVGGVIVAEPALLAEKADRANLFVVGIGASP